MLKRDMGGYLLHLVLVILLVAEATQAEDRTPISEDPLSISAFNIRTFGIQRLKHAHVIPILKTVRLIFLVEIDSYICICRFDTEREWRSTPIRVEFKRICKNPF